MTVGMTAVCSYETETQLAEVVARVNAAEAAGSIAPWSHEVRTLQDTLQQALLRVWRIAARHAAQLLSVSSCGTGSQQHSA